MADLVSIVIPTYNRAHLLGETLDSILTQIYNEWECIIVDDGSKDTTEELLKIYSERDKRFKFFFRPANSPKGANSCRNFGLRCSKGKYIIWFDSDDLMTPDHIQEKVWAIKKSNTDFVVARTQNFREGELLEPYIYEVQPYGIKASDFILRKIHWYTYDVIIHCEVANNISWNETMNSWQDYNYFCKMLLLSEKGIYLDKILTYRRLHSNSIQSDLMQEEEIFINGVLEGKFATYIDIRNSVDRNVRREMLFGIMNLCFDLSKTTESPLSEEIKKEVKEYFGPASDFFFQASLFFAKFFKKGYFLLAKAKKKGHKFSFSA